MNDIRSILKAAAGRLHFVSYLHWLHAVAVIVATAALLFVLAAKTSPVVSVPWLWVGPGLCVLALLVAFVLWTRRRQSELQVALAVDERLDLREKFSTALHVGGRDDAFARAAMDDAVAVARDARTRERVNRLFPIDPPRRWWMTPSLLAVAVLAALFLPQGNWFAEEAAEPAGATRPPEEVSMALESTVQKLKANEELADELKDLFEELDPNAFDPDALRTPEEAKREAIKKLSELNDRLNEITEGEKGKTVEALQQAMKQLDSPSESGLTKELTEAMSSGNFEAAKQKLDQMLAQANSGEMSAEQQQQMAQDLQALGEQLNQLAQEQQALQDALSKAGLDSSLAGNPQQLQQALQNNQNLTQQQKQQLQQMAQSQQQAMQMCQNMGQALMQMGQCMGSGQGQSQAMGQAGNQLGQCLSQGEALAQMLMQARAMSSDLAGQCQGLGRGLAQRPGSGGRNGAFGGPGQGAGGEAPKSKTVTSTKETKADNQNPDANIIARTLFEGPLIKGESQATFRDVARSAAESFADEVNDDQIPQKYHDAVKRYFGEMKEAAGLEDESEESDAGETAEEGDEGADDEL
jgi:hypothetical protein